MIYICHFFLLLSSFSSLVIGQRPGSSKATKPRDKKRWPVINDIQFNYKKKKEECFVADVVVVVVFNAASFCILLTYIYCTSVDGPTPRLIFTASSTGTHLRPLLFQKLLLGQAANSCLFFSSLLQRATPTDRHIFRSSPIQLSK